MGTLVLTKLQTLFGFHQFFHCFPGGSGGKASVYNAGDVASISGSGRSPREGNGNLLQYSCLKNSMDRGYSPWGHKESDTTERLTHKHTHKTLKIIYGLKLCNLNYICTGLSTLDSQTTWKIL